MGLSKSKFFSAKQNQLAKTASALAHPARIAIIEHLLKVKSCICGDIVVELPLAQATISQHLKVLKKANVIKGTIEGSAICYCLNTDSVRELMIFFEEMNNEIQPCC